MKEKITQRMFTRRRWRLSGGRCASRRTRQLVACTWCM